MGACSYGDHYEIRENPKDSTWPCVDRYKSRSFESKCFIKDIDLKGNDYILTLSVGGERKEYRVNVSSLKKEDYVYLQANKKNEYNQRRALLRKLSIVALKHAAENNIECKFSCADSSVQDVIVLRVPHPKVDRECILMCDRVGRKLNKHKIRTFQLIGSYNSGTNFCDDIIHWNLIMPRDCRWPLGSKHQPYKPLSRIALDNPQEEVLVILIVRNPIDWVGSMHTKPWCTNGIWGLPLDKFVHTKWNSNVDKNPNGELFENVFELRKFMASEMLNLRHTFRHFYLVNYEILKEHPAEILADIASKYGIKTRYFFTNKEPLTRDGRSIPFRKGEKPGQYSQKELEQFKEFLDVELEKDLGY